MYEMNQSTASKRKCNSDTQVTDLSPLASSDRLIALDIGFTQVIDLSPLAGMTELTYLDCRHCQMADFSPLFALKKLNSLNIPHVPISKSQLSRLQAALPSCKIVKQSMF